jgi:histone-lysine N-methyltransferase MLL3
MDGVGDILGGLGDDDDDLLDSLTAEMGADFNILEYADPELDTTDDEKTNLLDSLELDDSENAKEEKLKIQETEKLSKTNVVINSQQVNLQQSLQNRAHIPIPGGQNIVSQIPSTVNQIDSQNINQIPGTSQQNPQIVNQAGQQIVLNQPGGNNNFQRQQVRIKAIPPNQIPEIQQIHQQMMLQVNFYYKIWKF